MADSDTTSTSRSEADKPKKELIPNPDNSNHRFLPNDIMLLETANFADAVIICGQKSWNVHKIIICSRCDWFRKALDGNFEEARTNTVTIPESEFSSEYIACLIFYIYSGARDICKISDNEIPLVEKCVRLWVVADFYLFEPLQKDTLELMEGQLYSWLRKILSPEVRLQDPECILIIEQLFSAISAVYTDYPHARPVQNLILDFVHAGRLMWPYSSKFRELLPQAPQTFTHAFLVAIINGNTSKWTRNANELNYIEPRGDCTWCKAELVDWEENDDWVLDPQIMGGLVVESHWRCRSCVEEHGFKSPP